MVGCHSAQMSHSVTIKSNWCDGRVLSEHGRVANYLLDYVKEEEFCAIMKDVANIFNEIGKSESKGYHFYAKCFIPEDITETTELTVHMITKK